MRIGLIFLYLFIILSSIVADSIRGPVTDRIVITSEAEYQRQFAVSKEEIVIIELDSMNQFLKGIQFEIALPEMLKRYADSFAFVVYDQLKGKPKIGDKEINGRKVYMQVLPFLNKIYFKLPIGIYTPVTKNLPPGNYSLPAPFTQEDLPLCISIVPIMKGVPNSVLDMKFHLIASVDMEKKGFVEIGIKKPRGTDGEQVEIVLDGEKKQITDAPLIVESGIHSLTVKSLRFREGNRRFTVEPGKSTRVDVALEFEKTALLIEALPGYDVFLDGEKLEINGKREIPVKEGDHTVLFRLENHSVSKKIEVKNGKKYSISLIFDVEIVED